MGVVQYAVQSLGNFRERATNAIPPLLAVFSGPRTYYGTKSDAAVALSKIAREVSAKEVIPVFLRDLKNSPIGGLRNGGWQSANMSLITVGQMKDEADLVIPAIVEVTDNPHFSLMDRVSQNHKCLIYNDLHGSFWDIS